MIRPDRIILHFLTAMLWAQRSVCKLNQVGAIVTDEDMTQVLSIGYNGPARALPDQSCSAVVGGCGCLHAEENALIKCDYSIPDKIMISTCAPCYMCAQRVVNAKFKAVFFLWPYRNDDGIHVLKAANIRWTQYSPSIHYLLEALSPLTLKLQASMPSGGIDRSASLMPPTWERSASFPLRHRLSTGYDGFSPTPEEE